MVLTGGNIPLEHHRLPAFVGDVVGQLYKQTTEVIFRKALHPEASQRGFINFSNGLCKLQLPFLVGSAQRYLLRQLLGKMKGADWHPRKPQLKQRHFWVPALGANPERA